MTPPEAEVTELPSSPGARLRRERESRGLSQQQAAESLNLDPTVILHLEANDFAALGAPVFVKGHLRRYSSLLGLGDDEIDRHVGAEASSSTKRLGCLGTRLSAPARALVAAGAAAAAAAEAGA